MKADKEFARWRAFMEMKHLFKDIEKVRLEWKETEQLTPQKAEILKRAARRKFDQILERYELRLEEVPT